MEKINCPICDGSNFTFILKGKDNLHNMEGEFDIVRCANCGFLLTNPRPNSEDIKKYYPDEYGPYKLNFKQVAKIATLRKNFNWLFKMIDTKATLDINLGQKHAKVLEIGCGAGNFLYELKLLHPDWIISGTDFSEKSISTLKNHDIDVFVSDLTKIPSPSKSYDCIYGWMVVEHIHNLNQALSEVYRVLKDDGKFCFSVPNAGSWEFKYFGRYWLALHLPNHLYHFTEETILKLLEKNGFKVEKIIHQRTFANLFLSAKNIINDSPMPKIIKNPLIYILSWNLFYHFLTLPIAFFLAILKQSGRLTIIAKKI